MKEHPILFSAPMVRAILDGRKTQTRRVVKHQPPEDWHPASYCELNGYDRDGELSPDIVIGWGAVNDDGDYGIKCRYGRPGDHLWVRETWGYRGKSTSSADHFATESVFLSYEADEDKCARRTVVVPNGSLTDPVISQSIVGLQQMEEEAYHDALNKWWERKKRIPSIHMPRWASRITLEITDVRVERLNDISEADAIAEGCKGVNCPPDHEGDLSPQEEFRDLWQSINAAKHPWSSNPWVWVIAFKRVEA